MPSRERILSLGLRNPARQEPPQWLRTARANGHAVVRAVTRQRYDGGVHRPPPPPVCPPGWRTGPPSFVGVGSQRCGTTRWFDLIAAHPEVVPPLVAKELDYFDRFYVGGFSDEDVARYHMHFPREEGRKTGEWTPLYLSAPWVPGLLARSAPEARILVLLRDPVERYLSSVEHNARVAYQQGLPLSELAPVEAFMRGLYHSQVVHLLKYFDRSQILVLQYERCTRDPLGELQRTYEFLQLDDTSFAPDVTAHPHYQPKKPDLDDDTLAAYVQGYADDVQALARACPEIDLSLWPNFAHLVDERCVTDARVT